MHRRLSVTVIAALLFGSGCKEGTAPDSNVPAPAPIPSARHAGDSVPAAASAPTEDPAPESGAGDVVYDVFTGKPITGAKPLVIGPSAYVLPRRTDELESVPTLEALLDFFRRGVSHPLAPRRWRVAGLAPYASIQQAVEAGDLYALIDRLNGGTPPDVLDEQGRTPLLVAAAANRPYIADVLLERGADIGLRDALGNSVMHLAAKSTHVYTLENLNRHGAWIEARNNRNYTPLHEAAEAGDLVAVRRLVELGADKYSLADPNVISLPIILAAKKEHWDVTRYFRQQGQQLGLHMMVGLGDLPGVQSVLEFAPEAANRLDAMQNTPLMAAVHGGRCGMLPLLIDHGADVSLANIEGDTALALALRAGLLECAGILLERGSNINQKRTAGFERTLLNEAVLSNTLEVVQFMLDHGADPGLADENGRTPLHAAVDVNDIEKARALVAHGARSTAANTAGWSPVLVAARRGLTPMLAVLAAEDGALESATADGESPLHLAAVHGRDTTVAWLLDHGADVNREDVGRRTPLHRAAARGYADMVTLLLDHGAAIEAVDAQGKTPLLRAAEMGQQPVAALLLARDANADAVDREMKSSIYLALEHGYTELARFLFDHGAPAGTRNLAGRSLLFPAATADGVTGASWLVFLGEDVNLADKQGLTPLHLAAGGGDVDTVRYLIAQGANTLAAGAAGETPLHFAARRGNTMVMQVLIQHGADLAAADGEGRLPLHEAALAGHAPALRLLCSLGVDLNAVDQHGETPLHLAAAHGRYDAVYQLLKSGASVRVQNADGLSPRGLLDAELASPGGPERPDTAAGDAGLVRVRSLLDAVILEEYRAAATCGDREVMEGLLTVYPDFRAAMTLGRAPAHWAAQYGQVPILELLGKQGADLNQRSETADGFAPLHLAVHYNHPEAARWLLDAGVAPDLRSAGGATALDLATQDGLEAMVTLLNGR